MKKVIFTIALLLSGILMNNVQAQAGSSTPTVTLAPLNMVIGIPEMIIISLFSCMAITVLIVIIKKVTHK